MILADPISEDEAGRLFKELHHADLLLAVSGGADSMALMYLVSRWRSGLDVGAPKVHVATVDHGLRPGSRKEAERVAQEANRLRLPHTILTWQGPHPRSGLQEAARLARYRLLAAHIGELYGESRSAIVTGHHQEDQAETVLMRLARGSGVEGLTGMQPVTEFDGVGLLRPLLDVPKARLVKTLETAGMTWIEDPSNDNEDFERVRIRAALPHLAALGITPPMVALSAKRLGQAKQALKRATGLFISNHVAMHDGLYAATTVQAFAEAGPGIAARALAALIENFGGLSPTPRLARVEALTDDILAAARGDIALPMKRTLGGTCIQTASNGSVCIWRETGRRTLPVVRLVPGRSILWDGRFTIGLVRHSSLPPADYSVRALGSGDWNALKAHLPPEVLKSGPRHAYLSLPAIYAGDRLVAVPYFAASTAHSIPEFIDKSLLINIFSPERLPGRSEDQTIGTGLD
ncbi:MAG: tRNA(Ile)-lysidine synthase [Pseudomonadota bacterium]|jgi:tRNA(Ile)-lysidine synthase